MINLYNNIDSLYIKGVIFGICQMSSSIAEISSSITKCFLYFLVALTKKPIKRM